MPVQEILDLAQQGHPTAIATLMNYITQPRGVKVRVRRQEDELHILLEAEAAPDQQQTVLFVQGNLQNLQVQSIGRVTVYGRQQGDRLPAWQQTIILEEQGHDPASSQALPDDLLHDLPDLEQAPSAELTHELSEMAELTQELENAEIKPEEVLPKLASLELSTELSKSQNQTAEASYNTASSTSLLPSNEPTSDKPISEALREPVTSMDTSLPAMQSSDALSPVDATPSSLVNPIETTDAIATTEAPGILKRPESVFFLFFISVFLFWEAYLTLLEEEEASVSAKPKKVLSTSQLARRLKTSKSLIRRQKRIETFSEWTRSLDPEGIAWTYGRGVYLPVSVGQSWLTEEVGAVNNSL